jgi:hypothetical protein
MIMTMSVARISDLSLDKGQRLSKCKNELKEKME